MYEKDCNNFGSAHLLLHSHKKLFPFNTALFHTALSTYPNITLSDHEIAKICTAPHTTVLCPSIILVKTFIN